MAEPMARRVLCPDCGAPVPMEEGRGTATCPFCGTRSALVGREALPRYYFSPKSSAAEVRRSVLEKLVSSRLLTKRQQGKAIVVEVDLCFVPFTWVTAIATDLRREGVPRADIEEQRKRRQPAVWFEDYEVFRPACALPEWGLDAIRIDEVLEATKGTGLKPFKREEMSGWGRVFSPQLDRMDVHFPARDHVVARRGKIVFYPVWLVQYRLEAAVCRVTIDGVTGQVLWAVAPEDNAFQYWKSAVLVAVLGLALGHGLRLVFGDLVHDGSPSEPSLILGYLLLCMIAVFGSAIGLYILNILQFDQELVLHSGRVELRDPRGSSGMDFIDTVIQAMDRVKTGASGPDRRDE